ncbi:hypothetical protein SAMN04489761_3973 [Tenacibaculum sp. MAR_2009_124]|uniref:hypothetical protein n=1 Tax=Tenacibaculum sp. MAR_2009_124 TaxID=1250059 RepID=UPI00089931EC|nr:hypothetical protein [Tenacibaculum sp. MAR_2009_124]SEC92199.1 hypothetical protein SAMN04489761_3973 [Tenacibaculum sp. MAR_2009_124]
MNKRIKVIYGLLFICCIFSSISCKKETGKKENGDILNLSSYNEGSSKELCESSWFPHSQTPPPEEGKGSPFDTISTTNAIFHQWSWQKFLWLTKPISSKEREGSKPLFLDSKRLLQVNSRMQPVEQQQGALLVLSDTLQAGSSGVLKTNPAYGTSGKETTVFYSIHSDVTMLEAAEKFKDSILNGSLKKNNLSAFPVGSLELKVSWVATKAIAEKDLSNYYKTTAAVTRDGKDYVNTEVAMLGMHVVGVVENHPEFIWATFEHNTMAPNYNWKENKASSDNELLLFQKGVTSGIDGITWTGTSAKEKYKAFDLFQYGVPMNKGGAFMETSQEEPINFENIENINLCVKENLKDVWKNYFYNGSIWIDTDGLTKNQQTSLITGLAKSISNAYPGSFARGSLNCANATMETYTQTFQDSIQQINVSKLVNCFTCHNSISSNNNSPLYLSHIFRDYIKGEVDGKSLDQIELEKSKQELLDYQMNRLK